MKLGIMQPYFLPYIGYWQLMKAVDKYVIYDDVNFIKGGWINRNRILLNGEPKYLNIQMSGASPYKLINEIEINEDKIFIEKNMRMIYGAYKKAPYFSTIYPLVEKILFIEKNNLAEYLTETFTVICDYLEINTELIVSSTLKKDNNLHGQDKVLSICSSLGATSYYNAIGGQSLYSYEDFRRRGIALKFLKTNKIEYKQFDNVFVENLSILDVMMFNSKDKIIEFLDAFIIIEEDKDI